MITTSERLKSKKNFVICPYFSFYEQLKGVRALRGYFGPLYSQKLNVAFHQFHLIGLLEEQPKYKILAFILILPVAMVTKSKYQKNLSICCVPW